MSEPTVLEYAVILPSACKDRRISKSKPSTDV